MPPRCLSYFRAIGKVSTRISRLRIFARSCGKTSSRLVNRGSGFIERYVLTINYLRQIAQVIFPSLLVGWLFCLCFSVCLSVCLSVSNITVRLLWWEQGSVFMSSWPSDVTWLWVDRRRTARFEETEPDNRTSKTRYHERWKVITRRELKASGHSVHRDWYDLCASGAVLTLPGPADLCRVFGSTATVECLRDWPCGSHASPQHCLSDRLCLSVSVCLCVSIS